MNPRPNRIGRLALAVLSGSALLLPTPLGAHCDTLEGPVVAAARVALEKEDVTPALRWVKPEHEKEVREGFARTLVVRRQGPEARELAEMHFFETLVRLHRLGENAPYTGVSQGTKLDPVVAWTDQALETGSVDAVVQLVTQQVSAGIRRRFALALERKKHAEESVPGGREFVESYVQYTHYVERLYHAALEKSASHAAAETRPGPDPHD
jgi:hypothetical protein